MFLKKESCLDSKHYSSTNNSKLYSIIGSPKKTLSEQKKIVNSLLEQIEIEKNILVQLEPNENPEEAKRYRAQTIPTFVFLKEGRVVKTHADSDPENLRSEFERHSRR